MITIEDLCPSQPAAMTPTLRTHEAGAVLTIHEGGRMIRLTLTPEQVGALGGDVVRLLVGAMR